MSTPQSREFSVLAVFFSTEMWERYGFYVVQSLLALYLALHLHLTDARTYTLVGSFTALTYISPILGGWIADHYLGQKRAILTGAVLLFISYVVLSFSVSLRSLLSALAMIATGTGLLKPNISALLGRQYAPGDHRRDSGFTIFYLGITTGIILGTLLPAKLQGWFGWHTCFLSAAVGAILAYSVFFFGSRVMHIAEHTQKVHTLQNGLQAAIAIVVAYMVFYAVLLNAHAADLFFLGIVVLAIALVLKIAYHESGDQRRKTLSLLLLFVISTFFWSFYFEMFMVLTLFITRAVAPTVLGIAFPAPYYVAVQSFGMLVLGVLLSRVWSRLRYRNKAYAISLKFLSALVCMLMAYGIIFLTNAHGVVSGIISPWPILVAYLVISLAELLLSPIGLSAVTHLSNEKVVSTLMGVFFVSLGIGGFVAGQLAKLAAIGNAAAMSLSMVRDSYLHGFQVLITILSGALCVTLLLCFLIKHISRRIKWEALPVQE